MALIFEDESYAIRGAIFEVYKNKGAGFLEGVYQECLEIEFEHREIPFVSQPKIELDYRGTKLKTTYQPDLVCFDKIIIEIKSVSALSEVHKAQVHNYLKATGHRLGLLVNFGHSPQVEIDRIVL